MDVHAGVCGGGGGVGGVFKDVVVRETWMFRNVVVREMLLSDTRGSGFWGLGVWCV